MKLAIVTLTAAVLLPLAASAQTSSSCTTRCGIQFKVCQAAAEAELEECLDRADTPRAKALCAVAFAKLEDVCREKEATCIGNCPAD